MSFNQRAVKVALSAAAKGVVSDLAKIAASNIERDAPRDSNFLAETVQVIAVDGNGAAGRTERRTSRKSNQTVERLSLPTPALPADTAAVHIGADYALDAEIRDPFIWPNIEALAAALPSVVAKRRV
jgi:hypothetical protein